MKHPRCRHNKRRELCRDCGGSQICEHNKVKTQCKACGTALCSHKRWKGECALCRPENGYNRYKASARNREIIFLLSYDVFVDTIIQACRYCGERPCGGVDRLDNALGYTTDNSVPCCVTCNRMKLLLSETQFIEQVDKIHAYRNRA